MGNLSVIGLGLGVIVAIVAAFTAVPELGLIMLVAGALAGWDTEEASRARLMLTALVLTGLSGELNAVPAIGGHLANIFGTLGIAAVGASITVITQVIVARLKGALGS